MEAPRPDSGATTDDFEHVELEHSAKSEQAQPAAGAAAAPAPEQQEAATQPRAAAEEGAAGAAGAADAPGAAAAAGTATAAETAALPSSPPATKALHSVLGFFSSMTASPPPAAMEQKAAPAAGGGAAQQPAGGGEQAADEEAAAEQEYDPVAAFESEALEAAERLQHGVEEVRGRGCTGHKARMWAGGTGQASQCGAPPTDPNRPACPPQPCLPCALAVEQVGQKLLHGAAEAKESLATFAQGLSSWCVCHTRCKWASPLQSPLCPHTASTWSPGGVRNGCC